MRSKFLHAMGYKDDLSVGECFHYGKYVKKDLGIAREFYLRAAKQGEVRVFLQLKILSEEEGQEDEAYYYLGCMHEALLDWGKAFTAYEKGAALRHAGSLYKLGYLFKEDRFSDGQCVIKKNPAMTLTWYQKAASMDFDPALEELIKMSDTYPEAALTLAKMYEEGELFGTGNLSLAIQYYEKASQRSKEAAYRLGQLYHFGQYEEEGFPADLKSAFYYYTLAAQNGYSEAFCLLEELAHAVNEDEMWLTLGYLELKTFNRSSALLYFKICADKGNEEAREELNRLTEKNPAYAYELGKLYEKDQSILVACHYFVKGMLNNHLL